MEGKGEGEGKEKKENRKRNLKTSGDGEVKIVKENKFIYFSYLTPQIFIVLFFKFSFNNLLQKFICQN